MKPYTFFKHTGRSTQPSFELGEFANDGEARNHALTLLKGYPEYTAVEVWDGVSEPFTVERPKAARALASPKPAGMHSARSANSPHG